MSYDSIIHARTQFEGDSGFEPIWMPEQAFPFQQALIQWACLKGRGALFEDVGLGKSIQQIAWGENVVRKTNKPVLLLTPLAVGPQMEKEAAKFGMDAKRCKDGKHDGAARILITNYQRLHLFDKNDFAGVVCDESGILKNADGETKQRVIEFARWMPYRLLATATPSPNDFIELGNSSEALGYLGFQDMLSKFFKKNEKTASRSDEHRSGVWRFRGHGEQDFWRWVVSWARAIRKPSDMGFSDDRYILPPITINQHVVEASSIPEGFLLELPAVGFREQRSARKRSIEPRCEAVAKLCSDHDCSIAWCNLNPEGDLLEKLIPDCVQVSGADSDDAKEEKLQAFISGQAKRLVSKPQIAGQGLNLQHCAHQTFFASHSYQEWHQCKGRSHRFGQKRPVTIDVISSEGESNILDNLERKQIQADQLFEGLVRFMNDSLSVSIDRTHNNKIKLPPWLTA